MPTARQDQRTAAYPSYFAEQEVLGHRLEGVALIMRPQDVPQPWASFCRPHAIALDGYLDSGPRFDPDLPCANFDHHLDVERLATRATVGQVLLAVRLGLFDTFCDEQGPRADVYVNDCDEDVALSWFLLKYGGLTAQALNPVLNRLVFMVDVLDTTAGAYPFPADLDGLQELAWIYEPYRSFRLSGEIDNRDAMAYTAIVTATEERVIRYLTGRGDRIPLDTRYRVVSSTPRWVLVEELGAQARIGMFADGIRAFVSMRRRSSGSYSYAVGRMSGFVRFDVVQILHALNAAEGITGPDRWGGSQVVGGSPRLAGSQLPPEVVAQVVTATAEG